MPGISGTEAILGAAIKANIDAVVDKTDRDALFQAMAKAVIDHLIANAVVTVTVTGVTAGSSGAAGVGTIA